jgi:Tfp pilus assembly protein PilX
MRNQRGMVLPLTLIVMLVLSSVTLAMVSMAGFEPTISRNLTDVTQARTAAEAGLEFGYNVVAGTVNWNTLIASANGTYGVYLGLAGGARNPIGALTANAGAFVVTLRNDHKADDEAMTGQVGLVPLRDPTATADANNILILTSTGFSSGRADAGSARLRAVIKRPSSMLGPLQAAFALPGNEADTYFSGSAFTPRSRPAVPASTASRCRASCPPPTPGPTSRTSRARSPAPSGTGSAARSRTRASARTPAPTRSPPTPR